jgi:hypothetical protein
LRDLGGTRVFALAAEGERLRSERDALGAIGEAYGESPAWLAIPAPRFAPECFDLKTRGLGEILQKFVNYGHRVAIVGDVSVHLAASAAFRDFVREANRGRQIWFVASLQELTARLAAPQAG